MGSLWKLCSVEVIFCILWDLHQSLRLRLKLLLDFFISYWFLVFRIDWEFYLLNGIYCQMLLLTFCFVELFKTSCLSLGTGLSFSILSKLDCIDTWEMIGKWDHYKVRFVLWFYFVCCFEFFNFKYHLKSEVSWSLDGFLSGNRDLTVIYVIFFILKLIS